MRFTISLLLCATAAAAQSMPDHAAQKAAMKKLAFITGKWSGEATSFMTGSPQKVKHSEEVQYKLDGLVMLVEGTGRDPDTGEVRFNALATISFDDATKAYRIRSHTDGRYIDAELKLTGAKTFEWGFKTGPAEIKFYMKINEKGEWHETGELLLPNSPPRKTIDLLVRKQ